MEINTQHLNYNERRSLGLIPEHARNFTCLRYLSVFLSPRLLIARVKGSAPVVVHNPALARRTKAALDYGTKASSSTSLVIHQHLEVDNVKRGGCMSQLVHSIKWRITMLSLLRLKTASLPLFDPKKTMYLDESSSSTPLLRAERGVE
ncbi:hypothetical protein VNO77_03582 [Canavalia gladiata]|uniref:Uncharacterized protein n=1 Tax=Canavalia gladiata TaxID=3824 RepID=A0AAN9MV46_CANGL